LDKAVQRLPESLRVVFILRDINDMSTHETGEILGLSDTAVKTRLSRARLRLREDLSLYFGDRSKSLRETNHDESKEIAKYDQENMLLRNKGEDIE
jgi:predicted transcriptional regulator